jgi:crossover junction endodeoxyribonuclease RuvC
MRVLGIDPGTSLIGYGIVDLDGTNYQAVHYGDFRTPSNIPTSQRAQAIYAFFDELLKKYKPDRVSIEKLFFAKNAKTAMAVSEVRGILILASVHNQLEPLEFTPMQVKQSVSGFGGAQKDQVQRMVTMILQLEKIPKPDDVADALALAICGLHTTIV